MFFGRKAKEWIEERYARRSRVRFAEEDIKQLKADVHALKDFLGVEGYRAPQTYVMVRKRIE